MFDNISVKMQIKAGTLSRSSYLNSQHFLPNKTFSQERFCCCKSWSNGDNHSSLQNSSVSLINFRAQVSIFLHPVSPQLLRITHITSSTYQTVECAALARRLRLIIKTVVLQRPANEIKVGDKSRRGLSKQVHHCRQVTMAPNLLWSKMPSNNVR